MELTIIGGPQNDTFISYNSRGNSRGYSPPFGEI